MDELIIEAALEDGLDLNSYDRSDTVQIDKGSLMRIFEEIYRLGRRSAFMEAE